MAYQGYEELAGGAPTGGQLMVIRQASEPALFWSEADLRALKNTVAKGCDDAQFKVFIMACRRLSLDPFARQIVPITQGGGMTPQVTIDGLRLIAQRTGQYGGQIGPQWCGKDGVWHDVWLDDGPPAAARVAVIRRDFREPMWGVARFKSYAKGGTWNQMPDVMIAKVAESLALRKAFPQELSGVYTGEEMEQARAEHEPATIQHGAHTVDTVTGEVVEAPDEPTANVFADEPALPSWPDIQKRALAAGIDLDDWRGVVEEITRKTRAKDFTQQDKRAVLRYVMGLESAQQTAEPDNGDPDLLKNTPALQGGKLQ
jgi:phage recombination protein Bet